MRRWTLTLYLMIAAGIAVALAPRLLSAVRVGLVVDLPAPDPVPRDIHLLDTGTVAAQVVPVAPAAPAPVAPVAAIPEVTEVPAVLPPPRPAAVDPGLLIPELDEEPGVDWTEVPPPAAPAPDPTFWDDCPGCGMG